MNRVLMTRKCWNLMSDDESLGNKVIKSKYIWSRGMAVDFRKESFIWQDVGKGWSQFKENVCWEVGDRECINFWFDDWSGLGPIRHLLRGPLLEHEQDYTLSHCWEENSWNLTQISFDIPVWILNRLALIQISEHRKDFTNFKLAFNGKFMGNKVYEDVMVKKGVGMDISWIWKIPAHPKIQFFIWTLWFDRIAHNANLFIRKCVHSTECWLCREQVEDSLHVLRDCNLIKNFWKEHTTSDTFFTASLNGSSKT